MTDSNIIILIWLLGTVFSFLLPYLLKIWDGAIYVSDIKDFFTAMDIRYIFTAILTFFLGVFAEWDAFLIDALKYSLIQPEWKAYLLTFLSASGIMMLLNKTVKGIEIKRQ